MNKYGFIVFIFLGVLLNSAGQEISGTLIPNTLMHPFGIGVIAGVASVCLGDVIGELIKEQTKR